MTLLTLACLSFLSGAAVAIRHDVYPNEMYLDPQENYKLHWSYDTETIRFMVKVATTGFVGLGLSPNGGMAGADIVVAWVKDGEAHLHDMHGDPRENAAPTPDPHTDWVLIDGYEENGYTVVTFGRNIRTCDEVHDIQISMSTQRVIWAYSDRDPSDNTIDTLHQHSATDRGTRSVALLHSEHDVGTPELPDDVFDVDVRMDEHPVHQSDTTYYCKTVKLNQFKYNKHQIVAMEPIVQAGNEGIVHHFVLHFCEYNDPEMPADFAGEEFLSYMNGADLRSQKKMGKYVMSCKEIVGIWAVGGETFYFPDNVGYDIGGDGENVWMMLEVHYDNPDLRGDYIDSSGYKLWVTRESREYSAGMMSVFQNHFKYMAVPPHTEDFIARSYCPAEYIDEALNIYNIPEINIIAYALHGHLSATAARMRHFHNGTELPIWAYDETYDFNYQNYRTVQDVKISYGDSLMMECNYRNPRDSPLWGGEGTYEEMCVIYMLYYPRVRMIHCGSEIPVLDQLQIAAPEIDSFNRTADSVDTPGEYQGMTYKEVLTAVEWDDQKRESFQNRALTGDYLTYMYGVGLRGVTAVPDVPREAHHEQLPCISDVPRGENIGKGPGFINLNNISNITSGSPTLHLVHWCTAIASGTTLLWTILYIL